MLWAGNFNGYFFKPFTKSLEALKAGTLQAGMMTVVFLEMLRAVFSALFFTMKLPLCSVQHNGSYVG